MPFTAFKNKMSNVIFVITAIGAIVTLIGYARPVFRYANDLNRLVQQYEEINKSMDLIESHIREYEEARANKLKSFSIGLRSDTENGQIIYVDENNGIYRAFVDDRTKEYYYYDKEGNPIYCYTKKPVRYEPKHIEIKPLIMPDTSIVILDTIR
jgi:hypothetical protein